MKHFRLAILTFIFCAITFAANAQPPTKKVNSRPTKPAVKKTVEPFETADVAKMAQQCVRMETEAGNIEAEMYPESAPETVRNFLNLTALGAFDTTTFSRVVPGFVIQGGYPPSREKITSSIMTRMVRPIPDEPNQIKHERGILSMARGDEPNTASSSFFIIVKGGSHLDGKFAAFGRVINGMDIVDKIEKMPVENEKPLKPVRVKKVSLFPCPAKTEK